MAFKASNYIPSRAYTEIKQEAMKLKIFADRVVTLLSSEFSANNLNGIVATIVQHQARLNELKSTEGLAQYAKDQETDQSYDVVAEFSALMVLTNNALVEMKSIPVNSLITGWGVNGIVWNSFNTTATASLKATFQALSDGVV